jgi:hypothetical protein
MIDQYIYTRADGKKRTQYNGAKTFGFGMLGYTQGIQPALLEQLGKCAKYGFQDEREEKVPLDAQGGQLQIFAKRKVPNCGEYATFQKSYQLFHLPKGVTDPVEEEKYSSDARPLPITHGYVCSVYDPSELFHDPDQWFYLDYTDYNVNVRQATLTQQETLPSHPTPLWPLGQVLERVGLSIDQFVTAVRASFDAENYKTLVYLEVDMSQPDSYEVGAQLLRWMYHFLPFAMRREADYSTCYNKNCNGGDYTIVLVPTGVGQSPVRSAQVGFGYLFSQNQVVHTRTAKRVDFDASGSPYALWLEQVIRSVYQQEMEEAQQTLAALKEIYRWFDGLVRGLAEDDQCRTENYDAALWAYLKQGVYEGPHIPAADEGVTQSSEGDLAAIRTLLRFGDTVPLDILGVHIVVGSCQACQQGYSPDWVSLLTQVEGRKLPQLKHPLQEMFSVYLARALDEAPEGQVAQTYEDYLRLRREGGAEDGVLAVTLENALFPGNGRFWEMAGVSDSPENGAARISRWAGERLEGSANFSDYLSKVDDLVETAAQFQPEHFRQVMEQLTQGGLSKAATLAEHAGFQELAQCALSEGKMVELFPDLADPIQDGYGFLKELLMHRCETLIQESHDLIGLMEETASAFLPIKEQPVAVDLWNALMTQQMGRLADREKVKKEQLPLLLPDRPDLHRAATDQLHLAKELQVDSPTREAFYYQVCKYILQCDQYSHLTKELLLSLEEEAQEVDLRQLARENQTTWLYSAVMVLVEFVRSGSYGYESFENAKDNYPPPQEDKQGIQERVCLKALYRMFRNGRLDELEPELVDYYFHCVEEPESQKNGEPEEQLISKRSGVYETLLERKGEPALLALLESYPSSEPSGEEAEEEKKGLLGKLKLPRRTVEEEPAEPRFASFPWMKTTSQLLVVLTQVLGNEKRFEQLCQADPLACPKLMEGLMALAPEGTDQHRAAKELNTQLWQLYQSSAYQSGEATKELKALRKSGAYSA